MNLESFLYIQHGHTCTALVPLTPWVPLESHSVRPSVDHVRRQPYAEYKEPAGILTEQLSRGTHVYMCWTECWTERALMGRMKKTLNVGRTLRKKAGPTFL